MANALNLYDPLFYAQEGLIVLYKALGMAGRVHRGYDPSPQQKGSIIKIRRPSTFTAQDAPSAAQDLTPGDVAVTLSNWKEVKISLTDKELTFTKDDIIREHITPAAYALADKVDQDLVSQILKVASAVDQAGASVTLADVANVFKQLFGQNVPTADATNLHFMVDGVTQAGLQTLVAPWNTGGQQGQGTLQRGTIGQLLGMNVFGNQNKQTLAAAAIADDVGAINNGAGYNKGTTTIAFDGVSIAAAFKKGEIFVITGDTQPYVLTADATADGAGAVAAATIFPPLAAAVVDNAVVTFNRNNNATKTLNVAFHRNAFCLAMAPLSEMGDGLGARIATVTDPITGLSLRSRVFYVGDSSAVKVALDCLYGFETIDTNLASRYRV
jgi:hypothetical protein